MAYIPCDIEIILCLVDIRAETINRLTENGNTFTVNRLHFLLTVNRCKQFLVIIYIILITILYQIVKSATSGNLTLSGGQSSTVF